MEEALFAAVLSPAYLRRAENKISYLGNTSVRAYLTQGIFILDQNREVQSRVDSDWKYTGYSMKWNVLHSSWSSDI